MAPVRSTPRVVAPDARLPGRRRAAAAPDRPRLPKANPWPGPPGEWPSHCPLCFGALEPLPGAGGHARHRSARCSAQCVLTTRQYQPDELTIRGSHDVQVAARHRERFVAHWTRHYASMRRAWPALTIERFIAVIACVDVADLWSYRMLHDDDLAAVLLVLAGFLRVPDAPVADGPAATSTGVAGVAALAPTVRWVRFWFDASVRDVGDLWTAGSAAPRLFRVDYREPVVTPYPTGAHVHAWQAVEGMRDAWAQGADTRDPAVEAAERTAFECFLARPRAHGAGA
ncbi:hypothetical protein [Burkholderia sp. SIMBA_062]|uniref:hypothetical protein n=1 Tax=Burkholderia sp. SIMBA_062 TaxID=3085803 RepID=UPI00397AE599